MTEASHHTEVINLQSPLQQDP